MADGWRKGRLPRAATVSSSRAVRGGPPGNMRKLSSSPALLVSEIFGNSVRHSRSGDPGDMITVAVKVKVKVKVTGSAVRVEVTDRSGPGVPPIALRSAFDRTLQ